jgi:hypothetical protein
VGRVQSYDEAARAGWIGSERCLGPSTNPVAQQEGIR